jgi:anti-sigma factor RsiW
METESLHELTAAYALDALDEHDEPMYEEHLRTCSRCKEELASLRETAGALAYTVPPATPPPALRSRILERARAERAAVVPLRGRQLPRVLGAVATVAACAAIGLGVWAASLSSSLDETRSALDRQERLVAVLGDPRADRVAVSGADGTLVVSRAGEAALVLRGIPPAPPTKTYEVWIISGGTPEPAGTFEGESGRDAVLLTRPVPAGAVVAVTIEKDGGVDAPTARPRFSARI